MSDPVRSWEEIAEWWDRKQGDGGDLWHRALIYPAVMRVVGRVAGLRVLDMACGNGSMARKLARLGAMVTGADASPAMVERARAREAAEPLGITYLVADARRMEGLRDGSFHVVVSNMALMDIEDAGGAIREAARVLAPWGRFVSSIEHPCYAGERRAAWVVERSAGATTVWRKVSGYRETYPYTCRFRDPDGGLFYTQSYHRPLPWYFRALSAAGLLVAALEEPEPTAEFLESDDEGAWIAQVPLHCVFDAVKTPRPGG